MAEDQREGWKTEVNDWIKKASIEFDEPNVLNFNFEQKEFIYLSMFV